MQLEKKVPWYAASGHSTVVFTRYCIALHLQEIENFGFVSEKNHWMLDIGIFAFSLPKSSWKCRYLFGDQYTSLMSPLSNIQLSKNPKEWFVDLGSPSPIKTDTFNSCTQPSYIKAGHPGVWRQIDCSMDSTIFVNTLKEAYVSVFEFAI